MNDVALIGFTLAIRRPGSSYEGPRTISGEFKDVVMRESCITVGQYAYFVARTVCYYTLESRY